MWKTEKSLQKRDDQEETVWVVYFIDRDGYGENQERAGTGAIRDGGVD